MTLRARVEKMVEITIVKGVVGLCVVVNGVRVAGPKAWGGGKLLYNWKVRRSDLLAALRGER